MADAYKVGIKRGGLNFKGEDDNRTMRSVRYTALLGLRMTSQGRNDKRNMHRTTESRFIACSACFHAMSPQQMVCSAAHPPRAPAPSKPQDSLLSELFRKPLILTGPGEQQRQKRKLRS
eukprot:4312420-Amphidinium_carterae.1